MYLLGFAISIILLSECFAQQQNAAMMPNKMDRGCYDTPPTLRQARRQCSGGMLIPRFYWNERLNKCVMRKSCFYMRTGMRTMMECNKDCLCMQPPSEGRGGGAMCEREVMRWMYVGEMCVQRMFSGCGGNGNNFKTSAQCMQTCKPREPEFGNMGEIPSDMAAAMAFGGNRGGRGGGWGGSPGGWGGNGGGWGGSPGDWGGSPGGWGGNGGGGGGGRGGGGRGGGGGGGRRGNRNNNNGPPNNRNANNKAGRGGGPTTNFPKGPPSPTRPTLTTAPVTRALPSVRRTTPRPARWRSNKRGRGTTASNWGRTTTPPPAQYNPYQSYFLHEMMWK